MYIDPTTEAWRIINEYKELLEEVQSLDDDALVEECEEAFHYYENDEIGEILNSYWRMNTFFPTDRQKLEHYYILVHCKLLYGE